MAANKVVADEDVLDDFFAEWCRRYNVVATVEGALKFQGAQCAWRNVKSDHMLIYGRQASTEASLESALNDALWHKAKADYWLTAYQNSRVTNRGDYTRMFIRRPRLRRIVQFLMRFG